MLELFGSIKLFLMAYKTEILNIYEWLWAILIAYFYRTHDLYFLCIKVN